MTSSSTRPDGRGDPSPLRTDVRVLLLAGGPEDPTTRAWTAFLRRTGTPVQVLRPDPDRPLVAADLVHPDDPSRGRFNAVVAGTDTSAFWTSAPVLQEYRRRFGVRLLAAFEFPRAAAGLADLGGTDASGRTARVTRAGAAGFGYLRGGFPLSPGSYLYRAAVEDPRRFTTLVETSEGHPLVGVTDDGRGLQDALVLVNHDEWMLHGLLLARGLLTWVTRGVHLGLDRHHLACHVDDVLLANATVREGQAPPPGRPPLVRMTPADVDAVLAWQRERGLVLDLAFNGYGARADDDLTTSLLRHAAAFRWINHTWSHLDLDDLDTPALVAEIGANTTWAATVGIPAGATALVTGVHSGLDNPDLPDALRRCGVTAVAEDASVPAHGAGIGPATVVPRHPTNVYAHVSTWAELLEDYDAEYAAAGVSASTPAEFLAAETAIVLRHVLTNDVSPLFAHQANLAGERVLLTFLSHVVDEVAALLADGAPLVNVGMDDLAEELRRRAQWAPAVAAGHVVATVGAGVLEVRSTVAVDVPLTVPEGSVRRSRLRRRPVGEPYAGSRSGWVAVHPGDVLRVHLPGVERR